MKYDQYTFSNTTEKLILNQANILRKANIKSNNDHMDWYSYKIRNLVENLFARLKHFRDIATRFDKLKRNYTGVVALAYIDMVATMKCQQTLSE